MNELTLEELRIGVYLAQGWKWAAEQMQSGKWQRGMYSPHLQEFWADTLIYDAHQDAPLARYWDSGMGHPETSDADALAALREFVNSCRAIADVELTYNRYEAIWRCRLIRTDSSVVSGRSLMGLAVAICRAIVAFGEAQP